MSTDNSSSPTPPSPPQAGTESGEPSTPSRLKRGITQARRYFALAVRSILPAWIVGQIFRDSTHLTALCFYIPSPFVALLLLGKALRNIRKPRQALRPLLWMILPLLSTFLLDNHWDRRTIPTKGKETRRIVHWNIYGSNFGLKNIFQTVDESHPDLMVLSEVPKIIRDDRFHKRYAEGYSFLRIGNMVIIAKGKLTSLDVTPLTHGTVGLVEWNDRNRKRLVLVADLPSSILIARDPILRQINGLIEKHQPDFIVGDLNAPRLSNQLQRLPSGYRHAYDAVGSGWSYTWPVRWPMHSTLRPVLESILLAPVLSLDHCIVGPDVKPLHYDLRTTRFSDHRLQLLEFEN